MGNVERNENATDTRSLKLLAPVKIGWNSVFECINRGLKLKDSITKLSENDMEVGGRIDEKEDEDTSDGERGAKGHNIVRTTHSNYLLIPHILFLLRVITLWCLYVARVWACFQPRSLVCYQQSRSKMKIVRAWA